MFFWNVDEIVLSLPYLSSNISFKELLCSLYNYTNNWRKKIINDQVLIAKYLTPISPHQNTAHFTVTSTSKMGLLARSRCSILCILASLLLCHPGTTELLFTLPENEGTFLPSIHNSLDWSNVLCWTLCSKPHTDISTCLMPSEQSVICHTHISPASFSWPSTVLSSFPIGRYPVSRVVCISLLCSWTSSFPIHCSQERHTQDEIPLTSHMWY